VEDANVESISVAWRMSRQGMGKGKTLGHEASFDVFGQSQVGLGGMENFSDPTRVCPSPLGRLPSCASC
jgi:hypothetical protein